jgi:hypothetical protein
MPPDLLIKCPPGFSAAPGRRHRPGGQCPAFPGGAEAYFEKKGGKVLLRPTQEAISSFNAAKEHKIALMHVTC